jgi:pimeloyl-ACP methyl ester carboxylesterase
MVEALLSTVFIVMATVVCLAAIAHFWQWFYGAPTDQDETVYKRTEDGWRIALHRYGCEPATRGLPVVLCHGLSSNRYTFDMPSGPSLARFLAAQGRSVWVPELRGSGMSQVPGLRQSDVPYSWDFDDHLLKDVPAIIRHVLDATGAPAVHWVGHSMGGMLILAHVARHPDERIASAVVLGSPLDYSKIRNPGFDLLLKFRWLIRPLAVFPLPFVGRLLVPLAHVLPTRLVSLFHQPNIAPEIARRVFAVASQVVTSTKLWLDFGRFLATGTFAAANGKPYLAGIEKVSIPVLLASGAQDAMAPPDSVVLPRDNFTDDELHPSMVFGKASGCVEDYGHMDLVLGVRSAAEVFPRVLNWLEKHDEPSSRKPIAAGE